MQIIALAIIAARIHRELLTNSTESSWVTPLAYRKNELACKPDLSVAFACYLFINKYKQRVFLTVLASHKESVLSAEQVSNVFEYGRNTILFTESA